VTAAPRESTIAARYAANVVVVDAQHADSFINTAQNGVATLPESSAQISFDLGANYAGFIPQGDFVEPTYDQMPIGAPCWRRRHLPRQRSLGNLDFTDRNLAAIVARLPRFNDVSFESLNLEMALDRLGVLDVVYPSHVRVRLRPEPAGLLYEVRDPLGWLASFDRWDLAVETRHEGMLMNAATVSQSLTGTIPLQTPHAARYWFTGDGLLLDASGYTFIRTIATQLGIAEPDVSVDVGAHTVNIPVTPRLTQQVTVGESSPPSDAITARFLAASWREQITRHSRHDEVVFPNLDGSQCRAEGMRLLSEMVRSSGIVNRVVRIIDPYGVGVEALIALAPIAAGLPGGEIWLLSNNAPPPPKSIWDYVKRDFRKLVARLRGTTAQRLLDEDFIRVATNLARHLRITIRWYKPTIGLHDRFLEIGDRVWHVGHSFNAFGCDLSAIVEFRNREQTRILHNTMDEQFGDANLRRSFP